MLREIVWWGRIVIGTVLGVISAAMCIWALYLNWKAIPAIYKYWSSFGYDQLLEGSIMILIALQLFYIILGLLIWKIVERILPGFLENKRRNKDLNLIRRREELIRQGEIRHLDLDSQ